MTTHYNLSIEKTKPIDLVKLRIEIDQQPFAIAVGGIVLDRIRGILRVHTAQMLSEEHEALLRQLVDAHGQPRDENDEEPADEVIYDGPSIRHISRGLSYIPSKEKPQPLPPVVPVEEIAAGAAEAEASAKTASPTVE